MTRPIAVLLALAVLGVSGYAVLPRADPGPRLQAISGAGPAGAVADLGASTRRAPHQNDTGNSPAAATTLGPAPGATGSRTGDVSRGAVAPKEAEAGPGEQFSVTIDAMTATIPRRGPVRLRGSVTNLSDQTWTDLNIHPLTSATPMTTVAELEEAARSDAEAFIGERIVTPGAFDDDIQELPSGSTARWSVRVPRDALEISEEPGVYWIGVHVLGTNDEGRDSSADGRARSFIPLLGPRAEAVRTQLVVPLRHPVRRNARGKLRNLASWSAQLAPGGRLSNLADFVASARRLPVTMLIDPAVLEAAAQLAAGNPRRSLGPTVAPEEGDPEEGDTPDDADRPEAPPTLPVSGPAADWLEQVVGLAEDHDVLGLPYGDLDVVAAARHQPGLYTRAASLSADAFDELGIRAQPAVVPPTGSTPASTLQDIPPDTQVFIADAALPGATPGAAPDTVTVAGSRVAVHDSAVASGGPGPNDPLARVALRQRVLAAAAVRSLAGGEQRLQVVLPAGFDPGVGDRSFFRELRQPFLTFEDARVDPFGPAPEITELEYPDELAARELTELHLSATRQLIDTGTVLDGILAGTDLLAREVLGQALTAASYQVRDQAQQALARTLRAESLLTSRIQAIDLEAPSFVILSAESGPFTVTMTNDLDRPATVRIQALTDEDLVIRAPETVELPAESQQTVQLNAEALSIGVHTVRLVVTDENGTPIGAGDEVSIRANSVGKVIWVVLGAGVGILFLAIPVRWYRRWQRGRDA